jgi:sulfur carrier protein
MSGTATIRIVLNGDARELAGDATVAQAVAATGTPEPRGVAVAVDGEVVPRAEWELTPLADGQRVEVLHAVQGGS